MSSPSDIGGDLITNFYSIMLKLKKSLSVFIRPIRENPRSILSLPRSMFFLSLSSLLSLPSLLIKKTFSSLA